MATIDHITDHGARARALVPYKFRTKLRYLSLLNSVLIGAQTAEDTAWECIAENYLAVAVGVQLDNYGRILNCPRGGLVDDDYRTLLLGRIQGNISAGEPWRLTLILYLIAGLDGDIGTVRYIPLYPGASKFLLLRSSRMSSTMAARVKEWMRDLQPSGVGLEGIVEGKCYLPIKIFAFDSAPGVKTTTGFDNSHAQWACDLRDFMHDPG
jgi:hypothetical protein